MSRLVHKNTVGSAGAETARAEHCERWAPPNKVMSKRRADGIVIGFATHPIRIAMLPLRAMMPALTLWPPYVNPPEVPRMTPFRRFSLCLGLALLALVVSPAWSAERKKQWETLSDCRYVEEATNDGDSFHVKCSASELIVRLYYVDAPEKTLGGRNAERVREQADHFRINSDDIPAAGLKARDAVREILNKPFVVHTRKHAAGGLSSKPRYYALVEVDGKRLVEILVSEGLARAKGVQVRLPTGEKAKEYSQKLRELEAVSRKHRRGVWAHSRK